MHSPWDIVGLITVPDQDCMSAAVPNDIVKLGIERRVKITNSILVQSSDVLGVKE
jgi:hypothetical protein